jgi:hypothetical protein
MDTALAGYVRALRAAGADASTAGTLDAARAVALLGYAHRADLKTALGLALAKSDADKQVHDRVFDLYFSARAFGPTPADEDAVQRQLALSRAATAVGVNDVQLFTQAPYLTRRMLQEIGVAPLEARLVDLLDDPSPAAQAEARALQDTRDTLQREARALVDQRFELYGRPATESFMTDVAVQRPMGQLGRMAPEDMARMKAAVTRMARKLAARHARRQRVHRRGQLDMRRTLRANAGHDGVPFALAFKHTRREKPRIVAVCDVSGSVAGHVRFLLLFLYALHGELGHHMAGLRSFAFSNALKDVSAPLEQLPFDDAMALILKEVGMGSTDYGQAFADLHRQHLDCIDRHTTVLVLGDGRSNGTHPRLDLLSEIAGRAKRLVWLCPESPARWGTGDSAMLLYRPLCTSLTHCATVLDLERVVDDVLAAYG